jgi:hypothetical protein
MPDLEQIIPKALVRQVKGSKHPVLAVTILLTEAMDEASALLPQSVSSQQGPRRRAARGTALCWGAAAA